MLKTISILPKVASIFILVFSFLTLGFPLEDLLEVAKKTIADRKVVDTLYLSQKKDGRIVDRFTPKSAKASPGTRVRTVEFFAGQYASATLANQNAINSFPSQAFQLAETGSDIVDAYVEVSAQIGAATATTYNESFVYFDACVPTCTPSLTAFTTTAGLGTNSAESQAIRFRAYVTLEADIAAYTGGGASRTFQIGYCFDTTAGGGCAGTTSAQIQGANAKLVITYTYDDTSLTQTNTVIYPLDSGTDIGSKTAAQASCTMDSNCPTFSYNAEIPEIGTQLSQFFYLQSSINGNTTTDWQTISDIATGANTATVFFEEALSHNGGWVNVMQSGVSGYANNTAQSLEMSTNATNAYVMGGENYVTYSYSNAAAVKTRTVVWKVGEVQTVGSITKSALTGPTIYFPESGVDVKKAWFRIHTSAGGQTIASTLNITHKVGDNVESAARGYAFASDSQGVSDDGYLIYLIPASEYLEMEAATASLGKAVQMSAQWTTALGAVSAELVITYTYTGEASGYLVTQNLFAGQQTSAPATSYSTPTGAINPSLPEATGAKTIRSASLRAIGKDTSASANGTIGSNLTTSTCSATATSTPATDGEITKITLWKDVTVVVTNDDLTTYTACYAGNQASLWGGTITITYQWEPSVTATLTVATVGTQANIDSGTVNQHVGGTSTAAFTLQINTGSATLSSVKITETGSTTFNTYTNVRLYYENVATCAYNATESNVTAIPALEAITFSFPSVAVALSPNFTCLYLVFDVPSSAAGGETLDVQITNPSLDVVVTGASNTDTGLKALAGSTSIRPNVSSYSNSTEPALTDGARTGQAISISGAGFGTSCDGVANKVQIGTYTLSCTGATFTATTITIPIDSGINVYGGTGSSGLLVTIGSIADSGTRPTLYVYPDITSTTPTPASGAKEGDSVTLTGTKFRAIQGTGLVQFINCAGTDQTATVGTWSDISISVTVPAGIDDNDDSCDIRVTRDIDAKTDTTNNTANNLGTYVILPKIVSLAVCTACNADSARTYQGTEALTDGLLQLNGNHFGTAQGVNGKIEFTGGLGSGTPGATIHGTAEGACGVAGWTAAGTGICIEVTPAAILSTVYTGSITITRNDLTTHTFSTFRVLPRITSNTPTSGVIGDIIQLSGNHFCQSGTCPVSPNRSTAADNVKFGSTQALDSDFVNQTGGAGACNGTGAAWTHTEMCVRVPVGTPTGSQPTQVTSNTSYVSNTKAFTVQSTVPNNPTVSEPPSRQFKSNDITAIVLGLATNESSVFLKADLSSTLAINMLLQIEVQPTGTAFTCTGTNAIGVGGCSVYAGGTGTLEGTVLDGGGCNACTSLSQAKINFTGLTDGTKHWQARARNTTTNEYSAWVSYGGNLETDTDFRVDTTAPTISYGGLNTCNDADGTPGTNDATITFSLSETVDSGEIEYSTSPTFASGNKTQVNTTDLTSYSFNLTNLNSNTTYYWRVKATDFAPNSACRSNGVSGTTCPAPSPFCSFLTGSVSQPAKTTVFHIVGNIGQITNASPGSYTFSVFIPEASYSVKSALVEVRGVYDTTGTSPNRIAVQLNTQAIKSYDIPLVAGKSHFKIVYQATSVNVDPATNTLTVTPEANTSVYINSAAIYVTYAYNP